MTGGGAKENEEEAEEEGVIFRGEIGVCETQFSGRRTPLLQSLLTGCSWKLQLLSVGANFWRRSDPLILPSFKEELGREQFVDVSAAVSEDMAVDKEVFIDSDTLPLT